MYSVKISHKNLISKQICLQISDFLEEQIFMGGFFTVEDRDHTCMYIAYWLDTLIDTGDIVRHSVVISTPTVVDYSTNEYSISVKFKQKHCLVDTTVTLTVNYETLDDFIF